MTLFVVFGLVAVVIGVLVAVALGVRSMRAGDRTDDDDWDSPGADSKLTDPDDLGEPIRRRSDRRRRGARRASGRAQPDDYDGPRGYRGRGAQAGRSRGSNPDYGTDPGFGTDRGFGTAPGFSPEYQHVDGQAAPAGRGAEQAYGGDGYQRPPAPAAGPSGELPHLRDQESKLGGATNVSVNRPMSDDIKDPRVSAQARRRRTQQKEQPMKRARPPRRRGGGEGWNDTDWENVSDEDYWAELSSDKPLASRTAQSAADLRSPEPEQKKQQVTRNELKPPPSEPQTATMALPEFSAARLPGAEHADLQVPALPVRRSGSTTGPMPAVPAAARPVAHAAADYADPNLALLASLGEPAGEGRGRPAAGNGWISSAGEPPGTPPGGWAASRLGQRDGSQAGQDYRSVPGTSGGYHSAPPQAYGSPPYGIEQQASGYGNTTPGHGIPASPGYTPSSSYDTGPNTPATAAAPYRTRHRTGADQMAGQFGGHIDMTGAPGSGYAGSHASGSYDSAPYATPPDGGPSYGSPSYGSASQGSAALGSAPLGNASHGSTPHPADSPSIAAYGPGSYGPGSYGPDAYGTGSYGPDSHGPDSYGRGLYGPDSYGTAKGSHAAPGAGWAPQDATNGRHSEGSWQHDGQAGISGPVGATSVTGYSASLPNGYPGAHPAGAPGTPVGGFPRVEDPNPAKSYGNQPQAGGFTSGYLSSSGLSGRHGASEPEPLARPGDTGRQPRHRDSNGYDGQRSYGVYGDYGSGSRH